MLQWITHLAQPICEALHHIRRSRLTFFDQCSQAIVSEERFPCFIYQMVHECRFADTALPGNGDNVVAGVVWLKDAMDEEVYLVGTTNEDTFGISWLVSTVE